MHIESFYANFFRWRFIFELLTFLSLFFVFVLFSLSIPEPCSKIAFNIIYNPFAVLFVMICILLNTLTMALDHHDMSVELERILRAANYVSLTIAGETKPTSARHTFIRIHTFLYFIVSFNSIMSPLIYYFFANAIRHRTIIIKTKQKYRKYSCILLKNDECLIFTNKTETFSSGLCS